MGTYSCPVLNAKHIQPGGLQEVGQEKQLRDLRLLEATRRRKEAPRGWRLASGLDEK